MSARSARQIAAVLRDILPGGGAITAVTPMMTGFSNDTYLVEGPDLVLRMPPAAGAMLDGHDVIGQARIYAELGRNPGRPKPCPKSCISKQDSALLGAPFFLMRKVPGEAVSDIELQPWFTDVADEMRRQMCRDWVSAFAGLAHLQPLDTAGRSGQPCG